MKRFVRYSEYFLVIIFYLQKERPGLAVYEFRAATKNALITKRFAQVACCMKKKKEYPCRIFFPQNQNLFITGFSWTTLKKSFRLPQKYIATDRFQVYPLAAAIIF